MDLKSIVQELKSIGKASKEGSGNVPMDEHARTFLSIIESLSEEMQQLKSKTDSELDQDIDAILAETDSATASSSPLDSLTSMLGGGGTSGMAKAASSMFGNLNMSEMFNGTIGTIAQEVIQDLDMKELDLGDPSELLSNLLSGKIDDNNGLMGMVKNITDKIHTKISDSGVKEEDLVKEAESMMGNLQNMTKNNPLMSNLSEMFKNMPGAAPGGMPKNAQVKVDNNKVRLHSTRERLRRKLEKKTPSSAKKNSKW